MMIKKSYKQQCSKRNTDFRYSKFETLEYWQIKVILCQKIRYILTELEYIQPILLKNRLNILRVIVRTVRTGHKFIIPPHFPKIQI